MAAAQHTQRQLEQAVAPPLVPHQHMQVSQWCDFVVVQGEPYTHTPNRCDS